MFDIGKKWKRKTWKERKVKEEEEEWKWDDF